MDFSVVHRFDARPAAVMEAMVEPTFYAGLEVDDVGAFETTEVVVADGAVTIGLRFAYVGDVEPVVKRLVAGGEIVLLQSVTVRPKEMEGTLAVTPERFGELLQCDGHFTFETDGAVTTRSVTGSLKVRVPFLGGRAERSLLPGILARLDAEAEALNRWLAAR
jgi:hypothetical protein